MRLFPLLLVFSSVTASSQVAQKINLNTFDPYDNTYPHDFMGVGNSILFVSESCEHGEELWRYSQGEIKLFDILPGEESSQPSLFTFVGDDLYFRADTSTSIFSPQLFVYDTDLDSVYKVAPPGWSYPTRLIEYNSKLYCILSNPSQGKELWEITSSSSTQITNSSNSTVPSVLTSSPIGVYFNCSNEFGVELWFYNGGSPIMLADIFPGSGGSWPDHFHWVNDSLFFTADNGIHFDEPWVFDGVNANLVQDINPIGSSDIQNFFTGSNYVYFVAYHPSTGNELRIFEDNSLITYDIYPGLSSSQPANFHIMSGDLYFTANNGTDGNELFKYGNGTLNFIADINPGSNSAFSGITPFVEVAGELYFIANHMTYGYGIWKTDGLTVTMELDFPGNTGILASLVHSNGYFYFIGPDIAGNAQLWKYDGVSYEMISINPSGASAPSWFKSINDSLYFGATDGWNGIEPFKFNGATVDLMANTDEYSLGVSPNRLDTLNGQMFLNLGAPSPGPEYFHFDGSAITQVTDTSISYSNNPKDFINYWNGSENVILFKGSTTEYGSELWQFNGTHVTMLADIWPGTGNAYPGDFVFYNDVVLFSAQNPTYFNELWMYDGSTASLLADINVGGSSFPVLGEVYDNKVFFSANNGINGKELWFYDGASCNMLADINPGAGSSNPYTQIIYDNKLIFTANNGSIGTELYSWDGSSISLLADINLGSGSSNPSNFIVFNDVLFFNAIGETTGNELWSYSSSTGVQLVEDINPGIGGSVFYSSAKAILNSKLIFIANNGSEYRLFEFDGVSTNEINYPDNLDIEFSNNLITYQNNIYLTMNQGSYYPLYRYNGYNLIPVESSDSMEFSAPGWIYDGTLYGYGKYYCEENYLTLELWKIVDTIAVTQFTNIEDSACVSYNFNGVILNESGVYYGTNMDVSGNDSITILDLFIHPVEYSSLNEFACQYYNYNGDTLINSGTYNHVFTNQYGCDSIETLNLIIYQPDESDIILDGCDSVMFDNQWYTNSGQFSVNYSNINGCDSIVNLYVTVNSIEANVMQFGETLYAIPGVTQQYQWLNCDSSFLQITGEIVDHFLPSISGFYAVEITSDDNCVDTSDCIEFIIDDTGLDQSQNLNFNYQIMNDNLIVRFEVASERNIKLYDIQGKLIYDETINNEVVEVELNDLSRGIYHCLITSATENVSFKFVK